MCGGYSSESLIKSLWHNQVIYKTRNLATKFNSFQERLSCSLKVLTNFRKFCQIFCVISLKVLSIHYEINLCKSTQPLKKYLIRSLRLQIPPFCIEPWWKSWKRNRFLRNSRESHLHPLGCRTRLLCTKVFIYIP